jgi:hypothetical protein
MLMLINLSRPQSVAAGATGRAHLIQHATEKARMHAQQLTQAQTTQDAGSKSGGAGAAAGIAGSKSGQISSNGGNGSGNGNGARVAPTSGGGSSPINAVVSAGTPKSDLKQLPMNNNLGSSSPVNGDRDRIIGVPSSSSATTATVATATVPPPTNVGGTSVIVDAKLAIDMSITVEQITNHPIAVELLKDVMAADHSLENLMVIIFFFFMIMAYPFTHTILSLSFLILCLFPFILHISTHIDLPIT